ncbi:hypothetical protein [Pseudonocardia sp.]
MSERPSGVALQCGTAVLRDPMRNLHKIFGELPGTSRRQLHR